MSSQHKDCVRLNMIEVAANCSRELFVLTERRDFVKITEFFREIYVSFNAIFCSC
jgi:hypothetical protein